MAISADISVPIDDSKGGVFSWGKFQQDKTETVLVYIDAPEGTRGKHVQIGFQSHAMKVIVLGKEVMSGPLFAPVVVDECTWQIEGGKVLITLQKQEEGWWDRVWQEDEPVDTSKFDWVEDQISGMSDDQHSSMRSMVSRMFGSDDPTPGRAPTMDPNKD